MARRDPIAKGLEAERALNDPILAGAFESIERDIIDALATITLTGTVDCNALVVEKAHDLQANRRVIQKLREMTAYGKLEAHSQDAAERNTQSTDPRFRGKR